MGLSVIHYDPLCTMTSETTAPLTVSIDPRLAPEACQTMAEVRHGVDALDRALVTLLAERQGYMNAAARIKPQREQVRDDWRIEDVVSKVKAHSEQLGLSVAISEPVWRTLIEQCIQHELSKWDALRP